MPDESDRLIGSIDLNSKSTAQDLYNLVKTLDNSRASFRLDYINDPDADEPDFYLYVEEDRDDD